MEILLFKGPMNLVMLTRQIGGQHYHEIFGYGMVKICLV